ncbi:MAG: anhydro-N-acetylmuramic acid kinase [Pseudomonadota bacterium]
MIYIGCISGTSVDALDIAAVEIHDNGEMHILASSAPSLPTKLRNTLLTLGQPDQIHDVEQVAAADATLGDFTGEQICAFMKVHGLNGEDSPVAGIGAHGQTIRHRPGAFTVQIGDPNRIAETTGVTTVADFRRRDMAAGGQGAPLVPPFHQALFQPRVSAPTAILNIGGISNLTLLAPADAAPTGFDTGPGNGLLDSWCQQHQNQPYDQGGQWAASGNIDDKLLNRLLADPYFNQPPPKSTGREYFNLSWLLPALENQNAANVQATLCELTARSITAALTAWAPDTQQLVVCGGGRLNQFLMQRLQHNFNEQVVSCESMGIDGDSLEAAAFAWLAYRTLTGQSGNEPAVSGAEGYRILGGVYYA